VCGERERKRKRKRMVIFSTILHYTATLVKKKEEKKRHASDSPRDKVPYKKTKQQTEEKAKG